MSVVLAAYVGAIIGMLIGFNITRPLIKQQREFKDFWYKEAQTWLERWSKSEKARIQLLQNRDDSKDADWWKKGRYEN